MTVSVAEAPLWIALNGERRIILSCSPHDPVPLALGHLIAEGWIECADDVAAYHATDGGVDVSMDSVRVDECDALRRHQLAAGCGIRHFLDCEPGSLPRAAPVPPPVDVSALLRALFEQSSQGGVHACALSDSRALLHVAVDVARHCAVDRVIGQAALAGAAGGGLVLTARVSGAIALKAARARLGWIASRSVATSLAQEICATAGITLHERAGRLA